MASILDFTSKHRRSLQWIAGILVTYSFVGFLLVPWLAERQIKGLLQERLELEAEFGSLYFNPFTFYTELSGINVNEPDGSTLVALENFNGNMQVMRLFILQVRLSDLSVAGMDLYLERETESINTLSDLGRRWQATALVETVAQSPESTEPGELFPLSVDRIQLDNLRVHVTDRVPDEVLVSGVSLDSGTITNLSTLPDSQGSLDIKISTDDSAQIQTSATFSITPVRVEGDFALNEFALAPFSTYVSSVLPVSIDDGLLQVRFSYGVDLASGELVLELSGIDVSLEALALSSPETNGNFLQLGAIAIERGSARIPDNSVTISDVAINQLKLTASREADGSLDLLSLIPDLAESEVQEAVTEPLDTGTNAWSIAIDQLQLDDNALEFTDRALRTNYTRTVNLNLSVNDIDNQPDSRFPIDLTLGLDSGGLVSLHGDLTVLPALAANADLNLESLELNALAPFLAEYTTLNLQRGALDSTMTLAVNATEPFAAAGDIAVNDLLVIDTVRDSPLLSLPTLQVTGLDYSVADDRAEVSELLLADLSVRVIIDEDGSTNLGQSMRPSGSTAEEDTADPESETGTSSLPAITLGQISLQNAAMDFTDRDLPFEFNANVQDLNADINNISNTTSELTRVSLEGQVGEFGLMQLDSELDPFNFTDAATIDLRFSNIDLPGATPYAIKFAGREVDAGTIDLRLEYTLDDQTLVANNQMTLSDLELGDEIEYPDAMDLPLDLALALLKDSNGVIEFDVPVSGELNNPEFDLGPAIRRAISNILANIVTAPFRFLGSLVGAGEDAHIDQVRFLPGRADIAAPEQQNLLQLGEALTQRPELLLEIPLVQGGEVDRLALKTAAVTARIEELLAAASESEESTVERRTAILESLYSATDAPQPLTEIRALHTALPAPDAAGQTNNTAVSSLDTNAPRFDAIAYNSDLRDRLIAAEPIGETELATLARERLDEVREFLISNATLSPDRLIPQETVTVEEDEEGWLVMQFELGS